MFKTWWTSCTKKEAERASKKKCNNAKFYCLEKSAECAGEIFTAEEADKFEYTGRILSFSDEEERDDFLAVEAYRDTRQYRVKEDEPLSKK